MHRPCGRPPGAGPRSSASSRRSSSARRAHAPSAASCGPEARARGAACWRWSAVTPSPRAPTRSARRLAASAASRDVREWSTALPRVCSLRWMPRTAYQRRLPQLARHRNPPSQVGGAHGLRTHPIASAWNRAHRTSRGRSRRQVNDCGACGRARSWASHRVDARASRSPHLAPRPASSGQSNAEGVELVGGGDDRVAAPASAVPLRARTGAHQRAPGAHRCGRCASGSGRSGRSRARPARSTPCGSARHPTRLRRPAAPCPSTEEPAATAPVP